MAGMICWGNASSIAASTAATATRSQNRLDRICRKRLATSARWARMSPLLAAAGDESGDESGDGDGDGAPMLLSPEERAKLSLQDLDNRLAELSQRPIYTPADPPRVTYMTEELNDASNEKIEMPEEVSAGFLFFIGMGLLLLTVVNNLLFHYFIELPEREAQENMEKQQLSVKKVLDVNPTLAPQPQ